MKIYLVVILFTLFNIKNFAQLTNVDANIKKLNNSQFIIIHGDKPMFEMKSSAALKLKKAGKLATPKLIAALEDSTKVIMAHLALCHIYFNIATFAGPKEKTINDTTIYYYFLGQQNGEGLIISETKRNGLYKMYIEPENLKTIISFWKKYTSEK